MDLIHGLFDTIISDETLDNLIQSCTCLEHLKCLLQVKHQRISDGRCEKLSFSVNLIHNTTNNITLANETLKIALSVATNSNLIALQVNEFCLDKFDSDNNEAYYALNLFNVILEQLKTQNVQINFTQNDHERFHDSVIKILNSSFKPCTTLLLVHTIPNYLAVCDKKTINQFLTQTFEFIKRTKKLDVLCVCYNNFISSHLNDDFNLIKNEDFWSLLIECLGDKQQYMRKQAVHLLTKSIETTLKSHNSLHFPEYLKVENSDEIDKVWRNYLILLDVSDEKQLHIIEPSLPMINYVKYLNISWRCCLYKIFLNHPQNVVVYNVAIFILNNENEWEDFSKIFPELLIAINQNEYNEYSRRVFQELGSFCKKMNSVQFRSFLSSTLSVSWVPAAVWAFYSSIFNESSNFQIPALLVESILKKLKHIPHKFIRNATSTVILSYFIKNFTVDSLNDILKVAFVLHESNEKLFENFIRNNQEKILLVELRDHLLNNENVKHLEVEVKILKLLNYKISAETLNSVHLLFLEHFCSVDLEKVLLDKMDTVENYEEVANVLSATREFSFPKALEKASDILFKKEPSYNNPQKILAYAIISQQGTENSNSLIKFFQDYHDIKNNEHITDFFVKILLQSLNNCSDFENPLSILSDVLDSQNIATITILLNLSNILKHTNEGVLQFVERCFEEFLNLIKSGTGSKTITQKFLTQLFQIHLLENDEFCKKLCSFLETLLAISNSTNSIAYILSKQFFHLVEQNSEKGIQFVPFIIDLILYGIVVNKNERVEHYVCQEIELSMSAEDNPNFSETGARLWAFESMLNLVEKLDSEAADTFTSILLQKYMKYFSKRYFPNSQIHLEKLRILQALVLLHQHINHEKSKLIDFIVESFVLETHQPSIRYLMQMLLISLTKKDNSFIHRIGEKLRTIDNNRPSTVSGLIPVLYHLVSFQEESEWDQLVEVLLPYTMGAQFKLRIFSQVALVKLYEKSTKLKLLRLMEKYKFLYDSLKQVIEATSNVCDVTTIYREFLDFSCDYFTIFYEIPKNTGVTGTEYENLQKVSTRNEYKHLRFRNCDNQNIEDMPETLTSGGAEHIQKKITPWKDLLDNSEPINSDDCILVTSLVEKPANLGGLSRTCEVFGIRKMVMRTAKVTLDKEFKSLSMSSENWVDITEVKIEDLRKFILGVKERGYCVVGAEQTSESVKLEQFQFPKKTVLLLGNEKRGISADLIPLLDKCVEIPQFGLVRSLNVHVAGAIVLWEYCKQHKL